MATLLNIANNSTATAGTQARGILEHAYDYNYCNCPELSDTAASNYTLPGKDSKGVIRITDISGKLIQIINVNDKQGQKIWDIRHIKSGAYIFTLNAGGLSKSAKLFIK